MRYVGSLLALGIVISASVGLLLDPERSSELLAKEGPSEHLSHCIVAVAAFVWLLLGGRRPLALLGGLFFLIVLGEETDWRAIYGDGDGFNLHNALDGHLYSLFAIPLLALYGASLLARERLRLLLGAATPERVDLWALGLCVLLGPVAGLSTMTEHERALDEVIELALYVQCAWLGIVGVVAEWGRSAVDIGPAS